ncbi:MAG: hypothetical protein M5U23_04920 [Acidimicrobiia bacterium]|nr:hypothetical protein [Acidimicrobiia bacterium]
MPDNSHIQTLTPPGKIAFVKGGRQVDPIAPVPHAAVTLRVAIESKAGKMDRGIERRWHVSASEKP